MYHYYDSKPQSFHFHHTRVLGTCKYYHDVTVGAQCLTTTISPDITKGSYLVQGITVICLVCIEIIIPIDYWQEKLVPQVTCKQRVNIL